jgi:hypothetical protein
MKTIIAAIIAALALPTTAAFATVFTSNTTIAVGNATYDGQPIVVSNCTLTVNGPHSFASLQVVSNGVVTHTAAPNGEAGNLLSLTIAGDLGVDTSSRIDVSGRGYAAAAGPGAGAHYPSGYASGAGHGGMGGTCNNGGAGGGVYDAVLAPSVWGSGGGSGSFAVGGAGGGAISLVVTGTLQVDGVIVADGVTVGWTGGGGAGGSVQISAGTLAGGGSISARGGSTDITGGGGGGGGRIALYLATNNFAGVISAVGGLGYENGGAGTVYTKLAADAHGRVLVNNGGNAGQWTPLTTPEPFALIISNQARVYASTALTNQTLTVETNGLLSCITGQTNVNLTVLGDATVAAGGRIDVSGRGYAATNGPGAGTHHPSGYATGAGHGGTGGSTYSGGAGGGGYDSIFTPVLWGSGGGTGTFATGGAGGGAINLTVAGTLQVDGVVAADGVTVGWTGGGGAGGSLQISAGQLAGGGLISVRGGSTDITGGGGGGGGRIALYLTTNNFAGTISAVGGLGYENGGAGTIYTKLTADIYGKVLVDNGTNAGLTRLNSNLWPAGQVFDLTLSGHAIVKPDAPLTFMNLTLTNGANLTHDAAQNGFYITALGNALIASSASINVDGLGYGSDTGPGTGSLCKSGAGSGAGHGGAGQSSYNFESPGNPPIVAPGGGTYGSSNAPITLGSGGARTSGGGGGGAGGGAIKLTVAGTLQLDGAISANGLTGVTYSGSGSGGSIWISADSLTGIGSVSALGGAASSCGAAGGGGRIAIDTYSTAGFDTNHISITGAAGWGSLVFGYPPPQPNAEVAGSALQLSWHAGNGANYQVWSSPDLINWSLYGPVRVGTGGILTQDCPMTNSPAMFFRVQLGD